MKKSIYIFFILSVLLIISDQVSKIAIRNHFGVINVQKNFMRSDFKDIDIIGTSVQFTYTENEGMAMGISFGPFKVILSIFSILAAIGLSMYLLKLKDYSKWVQLGVALILAGAVGNLIDRVFYGLIFKYDSLFWGRVIDFIQVDIPDINIFGLRYTHFPIFNVADSCVSVGVVLLIICYKKIPTFDSLFGKKNKEVVVQSIPEINDNKDLDEQQSGS